ncbi:MAG: 30S ribosomal protein S9 [Candidatus Heimdallarchaeota archaeon LC_3]|uniref:Putative 30S ribosomal protein S9 n=1 Tax=uncultured organism TaxID=155900 RepID=A0A0F6PZW9_9ZZZZ|nr:putative 30S ribosomal protein S9 [uncultured organism]OLS27733.1 MAG: 30S ribosomal protein S9 [Candidatus Heimdallarchaeota archaeon LC_3]
MKKTINTSGKRKTAIARATFKPGKGRIFINRVPLEIIEPEMVRYKMMEPLLFVTDDVKKEFDIFIKVKGGGFMSQADAVSISIARGLIYWTESSDLRETFNQYERHMLVGDSRRKETKKFGGSGARSRYTKSYR